jgi:Tfp pilus assembly protein PilN
MRPVNLIPPEERRDKAAIRTGPIAYLLVGALAIALGAVTMLVLTNNKIADRKSDITSLQQQEAAAKTQAEQFASFTQFATLAESRRATIKSLADSRFDWERVMRELARVIPADVWLTDLSGATSGGASSASSGSGGGGASIDTSSITGPSIQLTGCAAGQDSTAGFLAALRDIDGVTRVALASSDLADSSSGGGGDSSANDTDCTQRSFLAKFVIVAAFDSVPAPQVPGAAPATPTSPTPAPGSTESTPASDTSAAATPGT